MLSASLSKTFSSFLPVWQPREVPGGYYGDIPQSRPSQKPTQLSQIHVFWFSSPLTHFSGHTSAKNTHTCYKNQYTIKYPFTILKSHLPLGNLAIHAIITKDISHYGFMKKRDISHYSFMKKRKKKEKRHQSLWFYEKKKIKIKDISYNDFMKKKRHQSSWFYEKKKKISVIMVL